MAYSRYVTEFKDKDNNVYGVSDDKCRESVESLKSALNSEGNGLGAMKNRVNWSTSEFLQGSRSPATRGIESTSNRCTLAKEVYLHVNDTIAITNNGTQQYNLCGPTAVIFSWRQSSKTQTIETEGFYYVNARNSDNSNVSPSDLSIVVTVNDNTSDLKNLIDSFAENQKNERNVADTVSELVSQVGANNIIVSRYTTNGNVYAEPTKTKVNARKGQEFTVELSDPNNAVFGDNTVAFYAWLDGSASEVRYTPNNLAPNSKITIKDKDHAVDYVGILKTGANAGTFDIKVGISDKGLQDIAFTASTVSQPLYRFPRTIRRGETFEVTVHADSGCLNQYVRFYLLQPGAADATRIEDIEVNIPTLVTPNYDITAFKIYTTPSASGKGYYEVKMPEEGNDIRMQVPSYYFADNYIQNKVARVEELIKACAGNGDMFIFITDEHFDRSARRSPALIHYLQSQLNIPRLFSGGDMHEDGPSYEMVSFLRQAFSGKQYYAVGNHEYLPVGTVSNDDNMIAYSYYMFNDEIVGNPERHYYYVDNAQKKIRYIVLNAFQKDPDSETAINGYTQEELTWFENVALNVETGWTIIIFTHLLYHVAMATNVLYVWDSNARDIIEQYNGNGTIAAVFQGHTHRDRYHILNNGVPVIITTCDKNRPYIHDGVADIDVTRTSGTIREQAFEVVVVNKTAKKINVVRIGGKARNGEDDTPGSEVEEREFSYGT